MIQQVEQPRQARHTRTVSSWVHAVVKAIFFDVFGTIVDWRKGLTEGLGRGLARFGADIDIPALTGTWVDQIRQEQARAGTSSGSWKASCRTGLEAALRAHAGELPLTERDYETLVRAWERLPAWPDAVPGLRALRREYVIAPCCDAPVSTMTWLAKTAGLPWDIIIGPDITGTRLPDPEHYLASARLLALDPEQIMIVSAHNADLAVARASGFRTGFFSRPREHGPHQEADLAPAEAWDIVAFDLLDLARHLEAALY